MQPVTFTAEEAAAIEELIDSLSGGNPENAFAHDGSDSLDDVQTRAIAKLYKAADRNHLIPKNLRDQVKL